MPLDFELVLPFGSRRRRSQQTTTKTVPRRRMWPLAKSPPPHPCDEMSHVNDTFRLWYFYLAYLTMVRYCTGGHRLQRYWRRRSLIVDLERRQSTRNESGGIYFLLPAESEKKKNGDEDCVRQNTYRMTHWDYHFMREDAITTIPYISYSL